MYRAGLGVTLLTVSVQKFSSSTFDTLKEHFTHNPLFVVVKLMLCYIEPLLDNRGIHVFKVCRIVSHFLTPQGYMAYCIVLGPDCQVHQARLPKRRLSKMLGLESKSLFSLLFTCSLSTESVESEADHEQSYHAG